MSSANEHQEKESLPQRVKDSPLSKLSPPLKSPQPLTSAACPLSSSSYRGMRRGLSSIITYVMERDHTSLERACRVAIDELNNLQSAGYEYLIDMQEGDQTCP